MSDKKRIDFEAIAADALADAHSFLTRLFPAGRVNGREFEVGDINGNPGDSLKINMHTGKWSDFAGGGKGGSDLIALYAAVHGKTMGEAAKDMAGWYNHEIAPAGDGKPRAPRKPKAEDSFRPMPVNDLKMPPISHYKFGEPTKLHIYQDAEGFPQYYVCRFELPDGEKQFATYSYGERKWDGKIKTGWHWKAWPDKRLIYGLPALAKNPDAPVVLVEGEKAAEAAQRMFPDRVAITWPGGGKAVHKTDWTPLAGRKVMAWPDADEPGLKAMNDILTILQPMGMKALFMLDPPEDVEKGWDVADYMLNHTPERYKALGARVRPWEPPQPELPADAAPAKAVVPYQRKAQASTTDNDQQSEDESYHIGSDPNIDDPDMPDFPAVEQIDSKGVGQIVEDEPDFIQLNNGRPTSTIENMQAMLAFLKVRSRFNVISKRCEFFIPNETGFLATDEAKMESSLTWIRSQAVTHRMSTDGYAENAHYVAARNPYNPVEEWILKKPWDGVSRLGDFYDTVTAQENNSLKEVLMHRWLISAVAAAFEKNGISAHGVLTFTGNQNIGKTHWFKKLVDPEVAEYIQDGINLNPSDKDSVKICISKWLIELGELDATFRKADIAALKAFITRQKDIQRPPYGRTEFEYARRTVFFASVNEEHFLHDPTGNRRFWVIKVEKINYKHNIDMQQLWAEVYDIYSRGETWFLTPDEMKMLEVSNKEFEAKGDVHNMLMTYYDFTQVKDRWLTATEIAIEIGIKNITRGVTIEIGREIRKLYHENSAFFRKSNGKVLIRMPLFENGKEINGINATDYTQRLGDF